jgi:hypothetical protein
MGRLEGKSPKIISRIEPQSGITIDGLSACDTTPRQSKGICIDLSSLKPP